jgi:Tfp pilus assembly protein FimT
MLVSDSKGYTLFDMLLVLGLMSIFLTASVHRFVFKDDLIIQRITHRAVHFLQEAQMNALSSARPVFVCPGDGSGHCVNRDQNWTDLLMKDSSRPITSWALPKGYVLRWFGHFHHRFRVQFEPNGYLDGQQGHFILYAKNKTKSLCRIDVSHFNMPHGVCFKG